MKVLATKISFCLLCPWQDDIFLSSYFLLCKLLGSPWVEQAANDVSWVQRKVVFFLSPLRFDRRSIPVFKHAPHPSMSSSRCHRPLLVMMSLGNSSYSPRHEERLGEVQSLLPSKGPADQSMWWRLKQKGSLCLPYPTSLILRKYKVYYIYSESCR